MPNNHVLVDACVARSVGQHTTKRMVYTYKILEALKAGAVGVCMTPALQGEWNRHASRYMTRWLVNMEQRNRVRRVRDRRIADFRRHISAQISDEGKRVEILKDAHITEAAILLGLGVVSLDKRQRHVLAELADRYPRVGMVQWFHPEINGPICIEWIRLGCVDVTVCCIVK